MSSNNCIGNLLKLICLLQDNSTDTCGLDSGCTKPFLGNSINCLCYNTRVVQLYRCNGSLIESTFVDEANTSLSSNLYRVMSVNNNCCTLLILNYDNENDNYTSTCQFITINLDCIGAVRCIRDVTINNL